MDAPVTEQPTNVHAKKVKEYKNGLFFVMNPLGGRIINTYAEKVNNPVNNASINNPWYHVVPVLNIVAPICDLAASGMLKIRIKEAKVDPNICASQNMQH